MSSFIAVTLVLLHVACTMAADGQQKRPISMEQADSNYGLRPEDARRIERMLENGETSSVEQEELARHASTRSVTTTVSVPVMSAPLWPLLVILSVTVVVAIYVIARHVQRDRRSETNQ